MAYSIDAIKGAYEHVQINYDFPYQLKDKQLESLHRLVNKENVLSVLPTGYGKSDIFVLVPLIMDCLEPNINHVSIVIAPLTSLMSDIKERYTDRGVKITMLSCKETVSPQMASSISNAEFSVVLLSPEILVEHWGNILWSSTNYTKGLVCIAIDEAHVLIQWGEKFRPAYQCLGELRSHFSKCPCFMTTATMTSTLMDEMYATLHFRRDEVHVIAVVPDRPNIFLNFVEKSNGDIENALDWYVKELLQKKQGARKAIVYCRNVRHTGRGFGTLMLQAKSTLSRFTDKLIAEYHAEVEDADKDRILNEFRKSNSKIRCLISTVAFGMGVDIPDIRLVIHWGESDTPAQYWQEVGRAGRDGQKSEAILYHRQFQLMQCSSEMKKVIDNVKQGLCMRKQVLSVLCLADMDIDKTCNLTKCQCCSICYKSCDHCNTN